MPFLKRLLLTLVSCALAAVVCAPTVLASTTQEALIEDNNQLAGNLTGTLQTFRNLGITRVKVAVYWNQLSPDATSYHAPKNFSATNPAAYPAANWAFLDSVDRQATADGLSVGVMVTGPGPLWATGPGMPHTSNCPCGQWKPSAPDYQAFMEAIGKRYSGRYAPTGASAVLPRVSWWSIWNEPNYGPDLAPQAIDHDTVEVGAVAYRGLLNAGWKGLAAAGHKPSSDTILIGETAPRGLDHPIGNFSGVKPLRFLRALYCVNAAFQELRGRQASERDCPTTAAASSRFRAANPALFGASGYADHPYAQGVPPNIPTYACGTTYCSNPKTRKSDPDYADFAEIGRLEMTLDHLNRVYGSHTRFPIWNTEYGYWTNPPDSDQKTAVNPTTAAYYLNWAEYLSYEQPRLRSYSQYLLVDAPSGSFADGLELSSGQPLPTFSAYAMPLYMPVTSAAHAATLVVWGGLRAASLALSTSGSPPQAQIQFAPGTSGVFSTVGTVTVTSSRGYFNARQTFTQSGQVRIAWTLPDGTTNYSRSQAITVA